MMERRWLLLLVLFSIILSVSASVTTSSLQDFGRSESCPGEMVVFTCNRSSLSHLLRVQTNSMTIEETLSTMTQPRIVSGFTFTVSQVIPGDRIITTVTVESSPALDGVVITCIDALAVTDPDPPNITAQVVDLSVTLLPPTVLNRTSVGVSPVLQNTPTVGQPCAGVYGVEVSTGGIVVRNVANSSADIVITDLDLCRNVYSFIAFFVSNSVPTRSQSVSLDVTPSDLGLGSVSGVVQVSSGGSDNLVWNSADTGTPMCVEGYTLTVNPPSGPTFNTTETFFPISSLGLTECVLTMVRVSPHVPVFTAPLDSNSGTGTATNFPQNFTIPEIDLSYCFDSDGNQRISIAWQPVTSDVNTTLVDYSTTVGGCNASVVADSRQNHTFTVTTGLAVEVCVSFQRDGCRRDSNKSVSVPSLITAVDVAPTCPTLFTVTLTVNTSLLCNDISSYRVQALLNNDTFDNDAVYENGVYTAAMSSSVGGLITGRVITTSGQVVDGSMDSEKSVVVLGYCDCNMGVCVGVPVVVGGGGVVVLVIIMIPVGYRLSNKKDKPDSPSSKSRKPRKDSEKQGLTGSSPPPEDRSLYQDPNKIEHQNAPGTEDQYAMVDVSGKKKKPTQEMALYQDPNTIQHETVPSGETYAVVDKPKRGSKKKEPDVVPSQGADGLMYADIDVAGSRRKPKPAPQHQTQDPGRVEYADVTAQL